MARETMRSGSPGPVSGGFRGRPLWGGPLQGMGTRAAAGGCVVGIDAEPGLDHQGAMWRAVLAPVIWGKRPVGTRSIPLEECCPLCWSSFPPTPPLTPSSWGAKGAGVITRALAAGLAVTGPFPGGPQMSWAAHAERLVGSQALDLPRLHTTLAGARTLGSPQLPRQTFAPGSS